MFGSKRRRAERLAAQLLLEQSRILNKFLHTKFVRLGVMLAAAYNEHMGTSYEVSEIKFRRGVTESGADCIQLVPNGGKVWSVEIDDPSFYANLGAEEKSFIRWMFIAVKFVAN